MISRLLELKEKLDGVTRNAFADSTGADGASRNAFADSTGAGEAVKRSFKVFVNKRQNRVAELAAKYVDAMLKKKASVSASESMEKSMVCLFVCLFVYIHPC